MLHIAFLQGVMDTLITEPHARPSSITPEVLHTFFFLRLHLLPPFVKAKLSAVYLEGPYKNKSMPRPLYGMHDSRG